MYEPMDGHVADTRAKKMVQKNVIDIRVKITVHLVKNELTPHLN